VTVSALAPSLHPIFAAISIIRVLVSSSIRFPLENAISSPHFLNLIITALAENSKRIVGNYPKKL
jgi:hypothetical protein